MTSLSRSLPLKTLAVLLAVLTWKFQAQASSDPSVVPIVDFNLYSGLWFDIAHNPNFFQRKCERSTAEYKVLSPTEVSVLNTCYQGGDKKSTIEGTAKVTDPNVSAKLVVDFGFFRKGDYWITKLDENYQWAVVSGPKKSSLFILSRTAPMNPSLLQSILKQLESEGYKTDELVFDKY